MGKKHKKRLQTEKSKNNACDAESTECGISINGLKNLTIRSFIESGKKDFYLQLILCITILGLILRFYHLDYNSIWLDEGTTLGAARGALGQIWSNYMSGSEFNTPLFYTLEHFILVFGESEFILRFIPALLGALTVPVVYLIGWEILDKKTGIIASALLAFSGFHIYYSQEARAYTTVLFFFSLAVLFYLWARKTRDIRFWISFGIFSSLALWANLYSSLAILALLIHAVITQRNEIKQNFRNLIPLAAAVITMFILTLPIIALSIGKFVEVTTRFKFMGYEGLDVIIQPIVQISNFDSILAVLFVILALAGIYAIYKKNPSSALLIILSLGVTYLTSIILASKMIILPRYFICTMPFFFASIAGSAEFIPKTINPKTTVVIAVILALIVGLPFMSSYYTNYSKNDWRGVSKVLTENTAEGDLVVILPGYLHQPFNYYYDNTTDGTIQFGVYTSEELSRIYGLRNSTYPQGTIYYLNTWDITAANPEGDAMQWLNEHAAYAGQISGIFVRVG